MFRRIICVAILFVGTTAISLADEAKTVRLLTIGNSFADNALKFLPGIVGATENKLIYARANLGGCTLQRHWDHVEKYEADQQDKAGSPYGNGQASLQKRLQQEPWDVVTIQQVSWQSHDPTTFRPYAGKLHAYIRRHAPQSKILLHQIWAYRVDDPRFTPQNEGKEPHTQAVMYQQVRDAYHTIANELNVGILPSGDAMYLADTNQQWGYRPDKEFNFNDAQPPALPDQTHSLHVGWRWKKQKQTTAKLHMDGHHANLAGEYLIGCVWYEVLFGQSVVDNRFVPKGLDAEYAQFLRTSAHEAVARATADRAAAVN
jgi:hypothetical protein